MASGAATAGDNAPRILLVDDEHSVQTLLTYPLRKDGYEVVAALDGREALDRFAEQRFDLVVLDLMLPKLDGLEVCRRLRGRSQVPIIILTAKDDEGDKVLGLEIGADDYITKPFSVREFRSRVKAALRRSEMLRGRPPGEPIVAGDIEIDFERRVATARGERGAAHLRRVRAPRVARALTRAGHDAARPCSSRSGATPPTATRGRSTSTSATCARSSSAIPGARVPAHRARGRLPVQRRRVSRELRFATAWRCCSS